MHLGLPDLPYYGRLSVCVTVGQLAMPSVSRGNASLGDACMMLALRLKGCRNTRLRGNVSAKTSVLAGPIMLYWDITSLFVHMHIAAFVMPVVVQCAAEGWQGCYPC